MSEDTTLEFMKRCHDDPVFFVEEVLGGNPWKVQREILYSIRDNKRTCVAACHASGKSRSSAWAALWFLLTHPNSIVFTTAPTARQVSNIKIKVLPYSNIRAITV